MQKRITRLKLRIEKMTSNLERFTGKAKQNLKWRISNKKGLLKKLEKLNSWGIR